MKFFALLICTLTAPLMSNAVPINLVYKQGQTGEENYAIRIKNVYLALPDMNKFLSLSPGLISFDSSEPPAPSELQSGECTPPYCFDWSSFDKHPITTKRPSSAALSSIEVEDKPLHFDLPLLITDMVAAASTELAPMESLENVVETEVKPSNSIRKNNKVTTTTSDAPEEATITIGAASTKVKLPTTAQKLATLNSENDEKEVFIPVKVILDSAREAIAKSS